MFYVSARAEGGVSLASGKWQVTSVASGKFRKRATGDGCRGLLLIEGTLKPVRGGATAYLKLIKALLSVSRLNNESGFHFVVVHVKNETYMIYVCRFKWYMNLALVVMPS